MSIKVTPTDLTNPILQSEKNKNLHQGYRSIIINPLKTMLFGVSLIKIKNKTKAIKYCSYPSSWTPASSGEPSGIGARPSKKAQ